jgi:hypothetical protein
MILKRTIAKTTTLISLNILKLALSQKRTFIVLFTRPCKKTWDALGEEL